MRVFFGGGGGRGRRGDRYIITTEGQELLSKYIFTTCTKDGLKLHFVLNVQLEKYPPANPHL